MFLMKRRATNWAGQFGLVESGRLAVQNKIIAEMTNWSLKICMTLYSKPWGRVGEQTRGRGAKSGREARDASHFTVRADSDSHEPAIYGQWSLSLRVYFPSLFYCRLYLQSIRAFQLSLCGPFVALVLGFPIFNPLFFFSNFFCLF